MIAHLLQDKQMTQNSPQHKPRNVLLLPLHSSSFQELLIVGQAIQADGRYQPVMVLPKAELDKYVGENTSQMGNITLKRLYQDKKDRVIENHRTIPNQLGKSQLKSFLRQWLPKSVRNSLPFALLEIVNTTRLLQHAKQQAQKVFDEFSPISLLVIGDRHLGAELAFLQVAKEYECRSIIVPFAYSGADMPARLRQDRPLHRLDSRAQKIVKEWIRRKYPKQVYNSPYGSMLFYTPAKTIALSKMKMLPDNPWCMGGGFSDLVAVSGSEDRERYMRMGVPAQKIVITGQPSHDSLYNLSCRVPELVTMLVQKYSLNRDKKLVICAVPQLAEHSLLDWDTHWQEIRFLTASLAQTGANVLLSLHPKSEIEQYRFLEQELSVRILQESLREVLPAADLFVATFSSTVRWAVLLGIPAVVVDFYGLGYDMYDHLAGIVKVKNKELLVQILQKVLKDQRYNESLRSEQQKSAQHIARFDGKVNQRIIDLIGKDLH